MMWGNWGLFGSRRRKERREAESMAQATAALTAQQINVGLAPIPVSFAVQPAVQAGTASHLSQQGGFWSLVGDRLAALSATGPGPAASFAPQLPPPNVAITPEQEAAIIQSQQAPSGVVVAIVGATVVFGVIGIAIALLGGGKRRRR